MLVGRGGDEDAVRTARSRAGPRPWRASRRPAAAHSSRRGGYGSTTSVTRIDGAPATARRCIGPSGPRRRARPPSRFPCPSWEGSQQPAVLVGDADGLGAVARRRSCRSPRTGGCARCPRRGAARRRCRRRSPPSRAARSTSVSRAGERATSPAARLSAASAGSTTRSPACTRRTASASWRGRRVLDDEPARAGLHRAAQVAGPAERRHDEHPDAGQRRAAARGVRADAVEPGHLDVEQGDVGPVLARRGDHLVAAARPRRRPRGRARGRAAPPARRGRAPGRRRAAAGSITAAAHSQRRSPRPSRRPRRRRGAPGRRRRARAGPTQPVRPADRRPVARPPAPRRRRATSTRVAAQRDGAACRARCAGSRW